MATTIKTYIVDANHGKSESDSPYDEIATFLGADIGGKTKISTTRLNGDRVFIVITKSVA
jgi:hypothetical protein